MGIARVSMPGLEKVMTIWIVTVKKKGESDGRTDLHLPGARGGQGGASGGQGDAFGPGGADGLPIRCGTMDASPQDTRGLPAGADP